MGKIILVIGNGFDLNLGLNTSYNHFINNDLFLNKTDKNKLFAYLLNKHNLQKWIDIENELKVYSKKAQNDINFKNEFNELCSVLVEYLKTIDTSLINKTSDAFKLIESLCKKDIAILDFNYTNSVKTIFESIINDKFTSYKPENHYKIHGEIDKNNIIFGIEDGASIIESHIFLKKSYSKSFGKSNPRIIMKQASEIYFFGHSLGETDYMYFKDLFSGLTYENQSNKKIFFYHYGDSDYDNAHKHLDKLTSQRLSYFKVLNDVQFINTDK